MLSPGYHVSGLPIILPLVVQLSRRYYYANAFYKIDPRMMLSCIFSCAAALDRHLADDKITRASVVFFLCQYFKSSASSPHAGCGPSHAAMCPRPPQTELQRKVGETSQRLRDSCPLRHTGQNDAALRWVGLSEEQVKCELFVLCMQTLVLSASFTARRPSL